jgi:hypothetical protein
MQEAPVEEVVRALLTLPPERVTEVRDFVLFLQSRYRQTVDVADAWTEDDIRDLVAASLAYGAGSSADSPDDPAE